jgi:hypothetical protein
MSVIMSATVIQGGGESLYMNRAITIKMITYRTSEKTPYAKAISAGSMHVSS